MGTTALGTRYADPSDPDNVPSTTKNLAEDVDLRSVPAFATTQLRDAAMQPASNGRMCVMVPPGGAPYLLVRSGGAWVEPTRSGFGAIALSTTNPQTVNSGTWTNLNWSNTDSTEGGGLGASSTGVSISQTGRYQVYGSARYPSNSAGNRRIAVATTAGAIISPYHLVPGVSVGAGGQDVVIIWEVAATAGNVLTMATWQDSGAGVQVADRRIVVRRVG